MREGKGGLGRGGGDYWFERELCFVLYIHSSSKEKGGTWSIGGGGGV